MRSEAQYETSRNGSSSRCCSARASQGANRDWLVITAIPVRMPYAYRMFDTATYSQKEHTMARNWRRVRPPA